MTLDRLLPLPEAARKFGLAEVKLRALIDKGTIRAGQLPTGEILVSEKDASAQKPTPKEELPEYQKYAHLKGVSIWLSEAARTYRIPLVTISQWVKKGVIKSLGMEGNKVLLDGADVAYCAEIYHRREGQGKWLFNRDGTPYKPKTGSLKPNGK
jgi:predicted site-specific integrase-resolvase